MMDGIALQVSLEPGTPQAVIVGPIMVYGILR